MLGPYNNNGLAPNGAGANISAGTDQLCLQALQQIVKAINGINLTLSESSVISLPIPIGQGGTGQVTQSTAFDALSPTTTRGDLIARGVSSNQRIALGSTGQVLTSNGSDPVWSTPHFLYATDFGAIGDGNSHPLSSRFATLAAAQAVYPFAVSLTDELDWCGLQKMAYQLATFGGWGIVPGNGPYLINHEVDFIPQNNTAAVLTGQQFPFSQTQPFRISSPQNCTIKATASINTMFSLQFNNVTFTATAPWYSIIEGFYFFGNGNADKAIFYNYAFGTIIRENRISGVNNYGIYATGYGAAHIYDNQIQAKYCIYDTDRNGDSVIESNGLYPGASGAGIRITYFGGDTQIRHNVITGTGVALDTIYGVQIDGTSTQANTTGNIVIDANEFAGMTNGVAIFGSSAVSPLNVYSISISQNHTAAQNAANTGSLVFAQNAQGLDIHGNWGNNEGSGGGIASSYFVQLANCLACKIRDNTVMNYNTSVVQLYDCDHVRINDNDFYDCAQDGAGDNFINLTLSSSGCFRNIIWNNKFYQSNAAYGQIGVIENTGCDFNEARDNYFQTVGTPYSSVGANSHFEYVTWGSASPGSGTYQVGAIVYNTAPTSGGFIGFVCTVAGSPGTWKTFGLIS